MFDSLVPSISNHLLMIPIGSCWSQVGCILVVCENAVFLGFTDVGRRGAEVEESFPGVSPKQNFIFLCVSGSKSVTATPLRPTCCVPWILDDVCLTKLRPIFIQERHIGFCSCFFWWFLSCACCDTCIVFYLDACVVSE